jgi:hypothetical protein
MSSTPAVVQAATPASTATTPSVASSNARTRRRPTTSATASLTDHFERVRLSLVSLYRLSSTPSHGTVQGTLREGFIRSALGGHLGDALAWSSGQIVTRATQNWLSGQLDLVIHKSNSPQIFLQENFVRLIPSSAVQAVIEVKSNMTTGDMSIGKSSVLLQALDSVCDARRAAADMEPTSAITRLNPDKIVPTFLVAFYSGQTPDRIITKISDYISYRNLDPSDFWPTAVLVLSGGEKNKKGFAIIKDADARFAGTNPTATTPNGVSCSIIKDSALAAFVCTLADKTEHVVDLLEYVFP